MYHNMSNSHFLAWPMWQLLVMSQTVCLRVAVFFMRTSVYVTRVPGTTAPCSSFGLHCCGWENATNIFLSYNEIVLCEGVCRVLYLKLWKGIY